MTPEERFSLVKEKFDQTLNTGLSLGGASPLVAITAVFFLSQMLFGFLKLGSAIRRKVEEQAQALDKDIRAQGIFHVPVTSSTSILDLQNFFSVGGTAELIAPNITKQFSKELKIVQDPSHPDFEVSLHLLKTAKDYFFDFTDNGRFDRDPQLNELLGVWLDSRDRNFYEVAQRIAILKKDDNMSLEDLRGRMDPYIQAMLQSERAHLENIEDEHLAELQEAVKDLVWNTVTDDDEGTIDSTLGFVVDFSNERVNQELERLEEKLAELNQNGMTDTDSIAERNQLEKRIGELQIKAVELRQLVG